MIQSNKKRKNIINESLSQSNENYLLKNSRFRHKESEIKVLNYIFRNISLINNNNMIKLITENEYIKISLEMKISKHLVRFYTENLFHNIKSLRKFLDKNKIKHNPKNLNRKVRIYLHKVHRIAPIFDYKRAKKNLRILQSFLVLNSFWPRISTQIAIIIYATDKNSSNNKRILQKNIRTLCNCSAYAFHRTKNILKID
ncbi:MAG: hypothetical protein ACFFDK_04020 [Promethearchaeota archaeon]